jgi:drug/metabolite transporter (DMT)-like permease
LTASSQPAATKRSLIGPLMVLAGATAVGFAPIGLRLSEFGPQATGFWRFLLAVPLIAVLIYAQGGKIGRPSFLSLAAGAFFGLDIALWHASLLLTSVANATFIVNLGPAAVGLVAWIVLKERPSKEWPLALGIALFGALLLSRGAKTTDAGALQGDLLALAAAMMIGLFVFLTKLARRTESTMNVLFWSTASMLAVSTIAALVKQERILPPDWTWLIVPFFIAVIAHVLGQGLIVAGVGRTPAAAAGILLLIQPVAAALMAWPLFGEGLAPVQLAGAALILAGVWLAGRR